MEILNHIKSELIFKVVKLVIALGFMLCLFAFFIFNITYMNINNFFSYDLLSFNYLWIFIYMYLATCIFILSALPFNAVFYYIIHKKEKDVIFGASLITVIFLVALVIVSIIDFGLPNKPWTIFCFIVVFIYFVLIDISINFYIDKQLPRMLIMLSLLLVSVVFLAIASPKLFNEAFKKFLLDESLAANKVEIYLKNKDKFVVGKMVFKDSKFAYVEYKDIIKIDDNVSLEQNISQVIPVENISILKD